MERIKNFFRRFTSKMRRKVKKNIKEKGAVEQLGDLQENHEHSVDCTSALLYEQHGAHAKIANTSSACTGSPNESSHEGFQAGSLKLKSLSRSSSTPSLALGTAPSLSLTSFHEVNFDYEHPTSVVHDYNKFQIFSSTSSLPNLDVSISFENLEQNQMTGYCYSSLELVSRNRCLSCSSIDCSADWDLCHGTDSSFSSQFDSSGLFQFQQAPSVEELSHTQLKRPPHQYNELGMDTFQAGLSLSPKGDNGVIPDTQDLLESPVCGKELYNGSPKMLLNLGNDIFPDKSNQLDSVKNEMGAKMEQRNEKSPGCFKSEQTSSIEDLNLTQLERLPHKCNRPGSDTVQGSLSLDPGGDIGVIADRDIKETEVTPSVKESPVYAEKPINGSPEMVPNLENAGLTSIPYQFNIGKFEVEANISQHHNSGKILKNVDRKHDIRKKGHQKELREQKNSRKFKQKRWIGNESMKRNKQTIHCIKGLDRRESLRRKTHLFQLKKRYKEGSLRRRAHVFHQKGWNGQFFSTKKANVLHQKGNVGEGSLRRRAHVFHLKGRYGKKGLKWKAHNMFKQKIWDKQEHHRRKLHTIYQRHCNRKERNMRTIHQNLLCVLHLRTMLNREYGMRAAANDHKCSRRKSENKKRKKLLNVSVDYDIPLYKRRPGGNPSTTKSRVLAPRSLQTGQDPQTPQQPTHPEVERTSQLAGQLSGNAAELLLEGSNQDFKSTDQCTTNIDAVDPGLPQAGQTSEGGGEACIVDLNKRLPSAKGHFDFKKRSISLVCTCQIDCILTTIILLVCFHPHMQQVFRDGDDGFQWLYCLLRKCSQGKFDDAKRAFWLQHGLALPMEDFIDFRVKLESEWILKPLKIKISQQMSNCKKCGNSCENQEGYFQDNIRAFAKRRHRHINFESFQDLFTAWCAEDVPCSKCDDGLCHVTRSLDCGQGPPPLLPVPLFFEESESSGCLGDFPFPIPIDNQEQPQDITIGNHQYRLHAISYAIRKQTSGGKSYKHERCQVWDDELGLWQVYDGEGWNADCRSKLKTSVDKTPGKSYRVAYFRILT